jgi:hypothetical protein
MVGNDLDLRVTPDPAADLPAVHSHPVGRADPVTELGHLPVDPHPPLTDPDLDLTART